MKLLLKPASTVRLQLLVFLFSVSAFANSQNQALDSEAIIRWQSDIDYFHVQLQKQHINLYHTVSRQQFEQELHTLKSNLHQLNQHQFMVEMMRITNLVGDGHTRMGYWGAPYRRFPLIVKRFDQDFRVIKTNKEFQHLLGLRLTKIDGNSIENIVATLEPYVPTTENQYSLKHFLSSTLTVAEVLYGVGVSKRVDQARFEFISDAGNSTQIVIEPIKQEAFDNVVNYPINQISSLETHLPEYRLANKIDNRLNLLINTEQRAAYLQFKQYPDANSMENFATQLSETLTEEKIQSLVIDFRDNYGGDFFVGLLLAWSLIIVDKLDWEQGLYVLINNGTFSAAVSNAAQFRQILNARLVGEPTGGSPHGYQDMDTFFLPHSRWPVNYSKRLYRFVDLHTSSLYPDILIKFDWQSYKTGKDPQLQWILDDINSRNH